MPLRLLCRFAWSLAAGLLSSGLVLGASPAADTFRLETWPASMPRPNFRLIDGDRHPRNLADYQGSLSIVFFGFTHCPDTCPATLVKLNVILGRLGPLAHQVHVLFITVDPERDTPESLKRFISGFGSQFIGLTGPVAAINAAADSFSGRYAKVTQGNGYVVDHSTGIYVVDRAGRLRLVGTPDRRTEDWVHDLKMLLGDSRGGSLR